MITAKEQAFRARAEALAVEAEKLREKIVELLRDTEADAEERFQRRDTTKDRAAMHSNIGCAALDRARFGAELTASECRGWAEHRARYDYEFTEPEK